MTFSLLTLGVLIILSIFNIGESIYSWLKVTKLQRLLILTAITVSYFLPNIKLFGINTSICGVVLGLMAVFILLKLKRIKLFAKLFVYTLFVFVLNIIYSLIEFNVYESSLIQPYLVLAGILGVSICFILNNPYLLFAGSYMGLMLSDFALYHFKYANNLDYSFVLGGEKIICTIIVSFCISAVVGFLVQKVKDVIKNKKAHAVAN